MERKGEEVAEAAFGRAEEPIWARGHLHQQLKPKSCTYP